MSVSRDNNGVLAKVKEFVASQIKTRRNGRFFRANVSWPLIVCAFFNYFCWYSLWLSSLGSQLVDSSAIFSLTNKRFYFLPFHFFPTSFERHYIKPQIEWESLQLYRIYFFLTTVELFSHFLPLFSLSFFINLFHYLFIILDFISKFFKFLS